jgi:beta-lactamase regulating signal transducer with metallopeptidase domain/uncharacterized GH25 family protein
MPIMSLEIRLLEIAAGATNVMIHWLVQSTVVIAVGLLAGRILRSRGAAVQSAVYRTTLVVAIACPLVTRLLSAAGLSFGTLSLPAIQVASVEEMPIETADMPNPMEPRIVSPNFTAAAPDPAAMFDDNRRLPVSGPRRHELEDRDSQRLMGRADTAVHPPTPVESKFSPASSSVAPAAVPSAKKADRRPAWVVQPAFAVGAVVFSLFWLAGFVWLMGQLTLDFIRIVQLRRTCAPAVDEEQQLCRQLAARMKVTPPELLRTPFISGPCLAGVWRPAVLLPEELPTTPLTTVLVHELAHLRRGDCFWNLLRQAATGAMFFQPLIWRLSRRIEATAEEVCDDHAVQFGADRQSYAELLVQLAERTLLVPPSVAVPLVTFRSLLARRVGRVLDHSRHLSLTVGLAALSLIIAAGLGGTLLTGLLGPSGGRAAAAPAASPSPEEPSGQKEMTPPGATDSAGAKSNTAAEISKTGDVPASEKKQLADLKLRYSGQVLDPDGKPVAGARVFFVYWIQGMPSDRSVGPRATTDGAGKFEFDVKGSDFESAANREWLNCSIVANAAGFGLAIGESIDFETTGEAQKQMPLAGLEYLRRRIGNHRPILKLVKDDVPITGRVIDAEGQPVAAAQLRVSELLLNQNESLDAWEKATEQPKADFFSLRHEMPIDLNGPQLLTIIPAATTDRDGRFAILGIGRERVAQLLISGPNIETKPAWVRTRRGEKVSVPLQWGMDTDPNHMYEVTIDLHPTFQPAEFTHVAGPSKPVVGTITDADSGQPLPGVLISAGQQSTFSAGGKPYIFATTDAQGHYRLAGLEAGRREQLYVFPPIDSAYLPDGDSVTVKLDVPEFTKDFKLRQGVWIRGRTIDDRTREPVTGPVQYLAYIDNPELKKSYPGIFRSDLVYERRSDANGQFAIAVPPGKGVLTFTADDHTRFHRGMGADTLTGPSQEMPGGAKVFRTAPLILMPGSFHIVREINPQSGSPLSEITLPLTSGVDVVGKIVDPDGKSLAGAVYSGSVSWGSWVSAQGDTFRVEGYYPDQPRELFFYQPDRNLAGYYKLTGSPPKNLTIKLQPAGAVRGRLVDDRSQPLADLKFNGEGVPSENFGDAKLRIGTDADGKFEIRGLLPGRRYTIMAYGGTLGGDLTIDPIEAGQTKDLGDVKLAPPQINGMFIAPQPAPEPKQKDDTKAEGGEGKAAAEPVEKKPTGFGSNTSVSPQRADSIPPISGSVTSPDGTPAAGASAVLVGMARGGRAWQLDESSSMKVLGQTKCDPQGRFQIPPAGAKSAGFEFVQLLVRSAQSGLVWRDVNLNDVPDPFNIKLPAAREVRGRLVTLEGQPAAGVRLTIDQIGRVDKSGNLDAAAGGDRGSEFPSEIWPTNVVTDADGRYTIAGVPEGADVWLRVDQEPYAPESWVWHADAKDAAHTRPLSPSQIIKGIVVAADTGQPLAHTRLEANPSLQAGKASPAVGGQSDADGRFRLNPFPDTDYEVTAFGSNNSAYLAKAIEFEWPKAAHEHEVRIELPRGVLVRGTIVEAGNEHPVSGAYVRYAPRANNPNIKDMSWDRLPQPTVVTDEQGQFNIAVPAGRGTLTVQAASGEYVLEELSERTISVGRSGGKRIYVHGHADLNLAKDASEAAVRVALHRGVTVQGEAVGVDDRPTEKLLLLYRGINVPDSEELDHFHPRIGDGKFEIRGVPTDGELPVVMFDPVRKEGKALRLGGADTAGPLRVKLEPCGTLTMRFVDPSGKPVAGHFPDLMMIFTPGVSMEMYFQSQADSKAVIADESFINFFDSWNCTKNWSDETGRVTFPALIPGVLYRLLGTDEKGKRTVEREITVQPGEHVELPDIVIKNSEVLRAAEKAWLEKQEGAKSDGGGGKAGTGTAAKVDDDLVTVRGRVVDPSGKPVSGADVLAPYWHYPSEKDPAPLASAKADANGRFELTFRKSQFDNLARNAGEWQFATIVAVAKDYGPAWVTYFDVASSGDITLQLVPDEPIDGRIVNLEGEPVAGARVELVGIQTNDEDNLSRWLDGIRAGTNVYHTEGSGTPNPNRYLNLEFPPLRQRATTDRDGKFRLTGIGCNRQGDLTMSGPGVTPSRLRVVARQMEPVVVNIGNDYIPNQPVTYFGAHFQYAAEPSQPVEGIVRDAKSGEPLVGVEIRATQFAGVHQYVGGMLTTATDQQGHYRLDGMPKGEGNRVLAVPNDDQPYFLREFNVPGGPELQTVKFDLELHRGTWIKGRVVAKSSNEPVLAYVRYVPWPGNPLVKEWPELRVLRDWREHEHFKTDRDGNFKIVGAPGRGLVAANATVQAFPRGQGLREIADLPDEQQFRTVGGRPDAGAATAVKEIRIDDNLREVKADFQLEAGQRVKIHVVDSAGNPLSNVMINGTDPPGFPTYGRTLGPEAEVGSLWPDEKRLLVLYQKERNLGKSLRVSVDNAKQGPITIVLEPCSTLKGRLLDQNGEPIHGGALMISTDQEESSVYLPEIRTDMQGRFVDAAIPPGGKYQISTGFKIIADELTVAPGETIDFGEIDVSSKTRPEPKRSVAKAEGGPRKGEMGASGATGSVSGATGSAGTSENSRATVAVNQKLSDGAGTARGTRDETVKADGDLLTVRGQIVDSQGQPVANADLQMFRDWHNSWPQEGMCPSGKTDATGKFQIEIRKSEYTHPGRPEDWPRWEGIWVWSTNLPPSCVALDDIRFDEHQDLMLRLAPEEPIEGRIVDLEGKPVVGAEIQVRDVSANKKDDWTELLADGRRGLSVDDARFFSEATFSFLGPEKPASFRTTTDSDGRFRITGVGRGRLAKLLLTGGRAVVASIQVVALPMDPITIETENSPRPESEIIYGSKFTFSAEPSQLIEGVVRDSKTGDPLAGVQVVSDAFAGNPDGRRNLLKIVSDAQGRYRLDGMPKGQGNRILAIPADGQPYFMCKFNVPTAPGFDVIRFDLQLHRGVLIEGRVADKVTGEPIAAAQMHYLPWPNNPNIGSMPEFTSGALPGNEFRYMSDANGRFHLVGLPGRGLIEVGVMFQPYPPGQGRADISDLPKREAFRKISQLFAPTELFPTALKEVRVGEHDRQITADIALQRGQPLTVRLVDPAGQELSGVDIQGLWPKPAGDGRVEFNTGPTAKVLGLSPNEKRLLLLHQKDRNLGKAISVSLADVKDGLVTIVLEPCATLTARLLDKNSDPVRGGRIRYEAEEGDYGLMLPEGITDANGRIINSALLPGGTYYVSCDSAQTNLHTVIPKLNVSAGEMVDLGEFDVTSEARPKPKRMAATDAKAEGGLRKTEMDASTEKEMMRKP